MSTARPSGSPKVTKPCHLGGHAFLAVLLLPAVLFVLPVSLFVLMQLHAVDQQASTVAAQELPKFMDRQRDLIRAERIRHYAELVYTAESTLTRRNAAINALSLAAEFSEPDTLDTIRSLAEARNSSDQILAQLHKAELLFREHVTHLALLLSQPFVPQYPRDSTYMISTRGRKHFETYRENTLLALQPLLDSCRVSAQPQVEALCVQVKEQWSSIEQAWQSRVLVEGEARNLWKELDETLPAFDDPESSAESASLYQYMNHIRDKAQAAYTGTLATLAMMLITCLGAAFCVHRFLLRPLVFAGCSMQNIHLGKGVEVSPVVRVRELWILLEQLPTLSRHLQELSVRSDQLEEEKDKYENLSYVDGLTGIHNRRYFDQQLALENRKSALSVLMLDVDMFKRYNDSLGHQAGDTALIAVAHAMREALLRSTDRVFRYGGEEFTVILSDAAEESAMAVAARILITIRDLNIPHPSSSVAPYLTVSIGVATRNPGDTFSDEELVARADRALYQAKSSGRDRISMYQVQ